MTPEHSHADRSPADLDPSKNAARLPYDPPRIEKRRSLKRVTLLTGMGVTGVGVISTM
jgi:hypothetical protein